jgi:hypothetical protein
MRKDGGMNALFWRTGGRTLFAQHGLLASDADELIGLMDTPELAAEVVAAHNDALIRARARARASDVPEPAELG